DAQTASDNKLTTIHTLTVDVRRAEGDRPQLTLPPGTRLREARPTLRGFTWVIDCLPGRHRFVVTGKIAAGAQLAEMPHVSAHASGETAGLRRWMALGRGVQSRSSTGL